MSVRSASVVIVGGGPAGLRAAAELAAVTDVLVLEREAVAGGIPRHSDHPGYGIRDLGRFVSGPRYAQLLRERAAGATILTGATVTGWAGERALAVTTPDGRLRVDAGAVVLATGARERPRPARLIAGDRGAGVYTTGHLQNLVHLKHGRVGTRAVVVGAELVSWSAVLTLRHAGCRTVLMTTEEPRPEIRLRPGVATRTRVARIIGRTRVEAVELVHLDTGARSTVACDTVVLTGDWIPDNELARLAGLAIDPASRSPIVDSALRTARPGVFAIGNLVHPVDTADVAALDGVAVARHVLAHLDGAVPDPREVPLVADAPFRWVAPHVLRPGDPLPPRRRLLLMPTAHIAFPQVVLRQDGAVRARVRVPWPAAPGRVFRLPATVLRGVDPLGGAVRIGIDA